MTLHLIQIKLERSSERYTTRQSVKILMMIVIIIIIIATSTSTQTDEFCCFLFVGIII